MYDVANIKQAIKAPVGAQAIEHLEQTRPDWLTRITRRRGGKTERLFWQSGGGYDRNIDNGRTLLNMIDYIHANPRSQGTGGQAQRLVLVERRVVC